MLIVLIANIENCWVQNNYILYLSYSKMAAYNNRLKGGCSPSIVTIPIAIIWSIVNGNYLRSQNATLVGSFNTTDFCISRSKINIACEISQFFLGVRYCYGSEKEVKGMTSVHASEWNNCIDKRKY